MTPDAVATDLPQELAATRAVFDELGRLKAQLTALRTVEDARIAYEALLERETHAIATLRSERDELTIKQRERRLAGARPETVAPPRRAGRTGVPTPQVEQRPAARRRRAQSADRLNLKKLVSRWQYVWALDAIVLAQVNSIADDAERPLGEALALLDWRLYETPVAGELDDEHAARVRDWRHVLAVYAEHLQSEISTVETRYRTVLAIWERWTNARASDAGRVEWERFIEATRAQKRSEAEALSGELAMLRRALEP
ncbi:MAG: hypothetical protein ABJD07_04925 [Gemmatimonadaceae bacterium]